ncbi:amidohydrolase family protein [candidate division KSB1 bacterium]|nr:amidohydrolase family protein [candidate division KSB1 bacterium]
MIPLFDVQNGFAGTTKGEITVTRRENCLRQMDKCQIEKSLVRIVPDKLELDIVYSNLKLYENCAHTDRLVPCPIMVPNTANDIGTEEHQVEQALENGAGAACLRFATDHWLPEEWVDKKLLDLLNHYQLPAFIQSTNLPLEKFAELAARFPDLAFIYANAGYRDQRLFIPLLKNFKNIYLSLGTRYTVHGGIEQLVTLVGPQQLLFGSGLPSSEPMSAIMQLVYSEIDEESKRLIGAGNLNNLIKRIRS